MLPDMPPPCSGAPPITRPSQLAAIREALDSDILSTPTAPDVYTFGKQAARLARLCLTRGARRAISGPHLLAAVTHRLPLGPGRQPGGPAISGAHGNPKGDGGGGFTEGRNIPRGSD